MATALTQKHNKFSILSQEICNLLYVINQDKSKINALIDDLNALDYKSGLFVMKHDAGPLLTALCLNVKPADGFLAAKASHLINSIITKQNLQFDNESLHKVLSWDIQCIRQCSEVVLLDILHSFQSIVQRWPRPAHKFTEELIGQNGILLQLIEDTQILHRKASDNPDTVCDVALLSLKCLCSLTMIQEDNKVNDNPLPIETVERISQAVIKFLYRDNLKSNDEFTYCKIVVYALRVLSQIYLGHGLKIVPMLPELMGICRHYVLYNLVIHGNTPQKLAPSQQTIAVPIIQPSKGGKKQKLRKQRNNAVESLKKEVPVSDRNLIKGAEQFDSNSYKPGSKNFLDIPKSKANICALTSDSDMSDAESGRDAKLLAVRTSLRQSASNLLLVLIKVTEKRDVFGYWWALFPDSPNAKKWAQEEGSKRTLAYCAVNDPAAVGRSGALSVILSLLSGSRLYLYQAEASKKQIASFIPFSVSLGYTITCLHRVLIDILDNERAPAVLLVCLKCCAALVQASPYHKLEEGLIGELIGAAQKFLVHRDVKLQVAALIAMGCVLSIDVRTDEVLKAFEKDVKLLSVNSKMGDDYLAVGDCDDFEEGYSDDDEIIIAKASTEEGAQSSELSISNHFKSWILDICFKNMGWTFKGNEIKRCLGAAIPVILESMQVISAITFHHFTPLLQSHIMLLADVFAELLQNEHQEIVAQTTRTVSSVGDALLKLEQSQECLPPLSQCVYFWEKLLTSPLSSVLQSQDNPSAKALACDCIANVGERAFKELPRRIQALCCALLTGSCADEESAVRAAAVRALAMAVMFRSLREDLCFVSDCGESILRALAEPALMVRAKGAWALGNLSDALVFNMEDPDIDDVDDDLLLRLMEVSIQCAADNDKVKMSATRALGNLLRLVTEGNLKRNTQLRSLCETAMHKLLECACKVSNMKIRWNACYAIGNAMKNKVLFTSLSGWQRQVLPSLCGLAQDCKNLKVRINAATALRSLYRDQLAGQLATVWRGVMAAMENAADVDDFTEYRHKDNLIEQLCVTLAHLCRQLTTLDLSDIVDPLCFHLDCAKTLCHQLHQRLPPDNDSCVLILEAAKYVTVSLTAETETQKQALAMLQEIFILDT